MLGGESARLISIFRFPKRKERCFGFQPGLCLTILPGAFGAIAPGS